METFVRRVIKSNGYAVCDEDGLSDLLWHFDCDKGVKTDLDLVNEITLDGQTPADRDFSEPCPWLGFPDCRKFPKDRNCQPWRNCGQETWNTK